MPFFDEQIRCKAMSHLLSGIREPSKTVPTVTVTGDEKSMDSVYYYRPDSVTRLAPHSYKVWTKVLNLKTGDQEKGFFALYLFEMRCADRQYKVTRIVFYDNKEKLLDDAPMPQARYEDPVPDTVGFFLLKRVCAAVD